MLRSPTGIRSLLAPDKACYLRHLKTRTVAAANPHRPFSQDPGFFEGLVLDVLQATGYGGSRDDAADRLGQSGGGAVDGVIREDRLGLDQIHVQAKEWAEPVGRPEIQKFFGARRGQRATKVVLITTSSFTRGAREYANDVTPRVILVDGRELASHDRLPRRRHPDADVHARAYRHRLLHQRRRRRHHRVAIETVGEIAREALKRYGK
jgi:predicted helicase